jgi:predicted dehydrogenase
LRFTDLFAFLSQTFGGQRVLTLETNEYLHPEHGAYIARNWRRRPELGGSYLLDKACHDFDVHARLMGCRPARIASFARQTVFGPHGLFKDQESAERYHLLDGGWNMAASAFSDDNELTDTQVIISEYENGGLATFNTCVHAGLRQRRLFVNGAAMCAEADFHRNRASVRPAYSDEKTEQKTFEGNFLDHYGGDPKIARAILDFARHGTFAVTPKETIEAGLIAMACDEAAAKAQTVDLTDTWDTLDSIL